MLCCIWARICSKVISEYSSFDGSRLQITPRSRRMMVVVSMSPPMDAIILDFGSIFDSV